MPSVTVTIKGRDRDCSSAVLTCLVAVGLVPAGTYMWTGNERSILKECGYVQVNLNHLQRGDILWKTGHTEMYLGDGMQGGARIDEAGGKHGYTKGDQTGNEIGRSAFDQSYWKWESAWRYFGSETLAGIPIAEATAQVMDHLIDHDAHGYSQDNRDGSGTERVTITWDGGTVPSKLDVDGWLGALSVRAWQRQLDTTQDGVVSGQSYGLRTSYPNLTAVEYGTGGSRLVRAVQRRAGAPVDGYLGPVTVRALQRRLADEGYWVGTLDGVLGANTAKAVQRSLNDGAWS